MFLHSVRSLLQTVRMFFRIFQIVLKVFLFPIWSVLPSFSTSKTSVINLEKFVYEARIDGYVTSKSGDEGIDGIIKEDKLGLDKIYVQAKRWKKDSKIGRPEIQKFVGALDGQRAKKGIFITTAFFSQEAINYANNTSNATVILIDGQKLTDLMIEYEAGVTVKDTIKICKIDTDFFVEE